MIYTRLSLASLPDIVLIHVRTLNAVLALVPLAAVILARVVVLIVAHALARQECSGKLRARARVGQVASQTARLPSKTLLTRKLATLAQPYRTDKGRVVLETRHRIRENEGIEGEKFVTLIR